MDAHRDKKRRTTNSYVTSLPTPNSSDRSTSPSIDGSIPATNLSAWDGPLGPEFFEQQFADYFPNANTDVQVVLPEIDTSSWNFGRDHYEGPHDASCFVCGGAGILFGCQTCADSYHSQCMFPAKDPNTVPELWFCPHCAETCMNTDSQSKIMPTGMMGNNESTANFSPNSILTHTSSTGGLQTPVSQTINPSFDGNEEAQIYQMQLRQQNVPNSTGPDYGYHNATSQNTMNDFSQFDLFAHQPVDANLSSGFPQTQNNVIQQSIPFDRQSTASSSVTDTSRDVGRSTSRRNHGGSLTESGFQPFENYASIEPDRASTSTTTKSKSSKEARHTSPSRKRSKYSSLPAELDDALALIHNHLESAYKAKKTDEGSADKIRILEQRLKMQENELIMARQEISRLKDAFSNAKNGQDQTTLLKRENEELRAVAKKRDEELKEWQRMLRTMMGSSVMSKLGEDGEGLLAGQAGEQSQLPSTLQGQQRSPHQ